MKRPVGATLHTGFHKKTVFTGYRAKLALENQLWWSTYATAPKVKATWKNGLEICHVIQQSSFYGIVDWNCKGHSQAYWDQYYGRRYARYPFWYLLYFHNNRRHCILRKVGKWKTQRWPLFEFDHWMGPLTRYSCNPGPYQNCSLRFRHCWHRPQYKWGFVSSLMVSTSMTDSTRIWPNCSVKRQHLLVSRSVWVVDLTSFSKTHLPKIQASDSKTYRSPIFNGTSMIDLLKILRCKNFGPENQ